jgi:glucose-6-phosphate isomerase
MKLALDFSGLLPAALGPEIGMSRARLDGLAGLVGSLHEQVRRERDSGMLGFMKLPGQYLGDAEYRQRLRSEADRLAGLGDAHVVLGIGGSYLGARTLKDALLNPYWNELSSSERARPRLYFEGNNLDNDHFTALRERLQAAAASGGGFTLNVISKSGGTLETAVAFRLLWGLTRDIYGEDGARQRIVATTGNGTMLHRLATEAGFSIFSIPDNVGGRYSVLTPVGLLPAAVAGMDIDALMQGAANMLAACDSADLSQNPAYLYAALQYLWYLERGRSVSVLSIWSNRLESLGLWYDQLCAESLGKEGLGRTPLTSVNTRDLHSRGQQHQEGAPDKVITHLVVGRPSTQPVTVPEQAGDPDQLNYLTGRALPELLEVAYRATDFAYHEAARPTMTIAIEELTPYTLGQLFMFFEIATVMEGKLLRVNPLDQPGVEAYKNFMFGLLGRADRREYRERFEARPKREPGSTLGDESLLP